MARVNKNGQLPKRRQMSSQEPTTPQQESHSTRRDATHPGRVGWFDGYCADDDDDAWAGLSPEEEKHGELWESRLFTD